MKCGCFHGAFWCFANRSSYPDRKEGEDADMEEEEELPDDKTLEYDDETLELTLPSGHMTSNTFSIISRIHDY